MSIAYMELIENRRAHNSLYSCQRLLRFLLSRVKSAEFDPSIVDALSVGTTAQFKIPISSLSDVSTEDKHAIEWYISTYNKNPKETEIAMAFALATPEFYSSLLDSDTNLVPTYVSLEQSGFIVGLVISGTAPTPRAYLDELLKDSPRFDNNQT